MAASTYALPQPPPALPRLPRCWVWLLSAVLMGYALCGKGVAYLSIPPLYVAEIVLLIGLGCAVCRPSAVWRAVSVRYLSLPLVLFMIWGATRTFPYLSGYGADAFRDGVLWGYGTFAVLVFTVAGADIHALRVFVRRFHCFATLYPYLSAVVLLIEIMGIAAPTLPGVGFPLVSIKTGDIAVHMAGVSAFFLAGLLRARRVLWFVSGFLSILICASGNRGAALSYLTAISFVLLFSVNARALVLRFLRPIGLLLGATFFLDTEVKLHQGREISLRQLVINYTSVFTSLDDNPGNTEVTKRWRLMWWGRIVDYTIFGDYFWGGKGYGVNLTISDGFKSKSGLLRNPHNAHMTVLARSGVIGLALWILLQGTWFVQVLKRRSRARRTGDRQWEALFLALAAYWTAFMVNASFDVFLEGPMGGVWFWVVFGFGLAAVRVYDTYNGPNAAQRVLWTLGEKS